MLGVTAFDKTDLNRVMEGIEIAFRILKQTEFHKKILTELKRQETSFYQGLASVNGKGFQLAQYEIFAGTPDFINQDVKIFWQLALPM
jgi:zinc protease